MLNISKYVLRNFIALRDITAGEEITPDDAIPMMYKNDHTLLPHFKVEKVDNEILVTDLGPWDKFPTVTNRARDVVEFLYDYGYLHEDQKLSYIDSDGCQDGIIHESGRFIRFEPNFVTVFGKELKHGFKKGGIKNPLIRESEGF